MPAQGSLEAVAGRKGNEKRIAGDALPKEGKPLGLDDRHR